MTEPIGLYLHIPFCRSKCPYCDFYSVVPNGNVISAYTAALCKRLDAYHSYTFNTVYFGGGTPSLLGGAQIAELLTHIRFTADAEITVECNPSDAGVPGGFDFERVAAAGVNRISLGLQSALDDERKKLGRRAGVKEASYAVKGAYAAGIRNISLDLMLGVSGQTEESLRRSLDFCVQSGARHISTYMLKIEPDTYYDMNRNKLVLPDEDAVCDFYLQTVEHLTNAGFPQYEISNFAVKGYESRHNLKYWHCEEYLGFGPAAHSFFNGKRFYYERDLQGFMAGNAPVDDGTGGDFEEYAMLALRLTEGLRFDTVKKRFGFPVPHSVTDKANALMQHGLTAVTDEGIALTPKGFLISNTVIAELLENV